MTNAAPDSVPAAPSEGRPSISHQRTAWAIGLALVGVMSLGLFSALFFARLTPPGSDSVLSATNLPKGFATVPDFSLTDQNRATFAAKDLRGKVSVWSFIFTRCHATCPTVSGQMARLRSELPMAIELVSLTVDPRYDGPDVLADYAKNFKADAAKWHFLTGDQGSVYRLIREGFKLPVAENPDADKAPEKIDPNRPAPERVSHASRLALVDRAGSIRGYFETSDPAAMILLRRRANELAVEP